MLYPFFRPRPLGNFQQHKCLPRFWTYGDINQQVLLKHMARATRPRTSWVLLTQNTFIHRDPIDKVQI